MRNAAAATANKLAELGWCFIFRSPASPVRCDTERWGVRARCSAVAASLMTPNYRPTRFLGSQLGIAWLSFYLFIFFTTAEPRQINWHSFSLLFWPLFAPNEASRIRKGKWKQEVEEEHIRFLNVVIDVHIDVMTIGPTSLLLETSHASTTTLRHFGPQNDDTHASLFALLIGTNPLLDDVINCLSKKGTALFACARQSDALMAFTCQ